DSYSAFVSGIWRYALRNKRNYRRIGPPSEFQHGSEVSSLDEEMDPSVSAIVRADQARANGANGSPYLPPNLWEYWQRRGDDGERKLLDRPPAAYLDDSRAKTSTAIWLLGLASAVFLALNLRYGGGWWRTHGAQALLAAMALPAIAWGADFLEHLLNHRLALRPDGPLAERRRGWLDQLLNVRLFCLAISFAGLLFLFLHAFRFFSYRVPAWEVLWLFVLALIALRLKAGWAWSNLPLAQLGQKSGTLFSNLSLTNRFRLQGREANPALVETANAERTLVLRGLWRELMGFFPACLLATLFGVWICASVAHAFLRNSTEALHRFAGLDLAPPVWITAAGVTLSYFLAAVLENALQRRAVAQNSKSAVPRLTLPFFLVCLASFLFAAMALLGLQLWRAFDAIAFWWNGSHCFAPVFSAAQRTLPAWLGLVAAALAVWFVYSAFRRPED
ncbi:MAG: hypothetical protein M3Y80_10785, partial [Verrucomicrobiota bacterium]|nr:hypothetical protein [Verrucomicrobiota bacterium]